MKRAVFMVILLSSIPATAWADSATISVGSGTFGDGRYSRPPPNVVVVDDDSPRPSIFVEHPTEPPKDDPYRSPFRLTVGPAAVTSGQGIGPGLLAAADFGTGTVGFRLSAAWFRGEAADDAAARLGTSLGLYSGELVLDLHKGGPLHPVLGLGLGAVNIGKDTGGGWAVAGLGRIGLEYAVAIDDADVRFGAGVTGALLGPADSTIASARAFAMMNATFSIGF
jgi:hypothetical protein